jgi:hypothetical protein
MREFNCGSALNSQHLALGASHMNDHNQQRAVRYRRIALAEPDKAKAALLFRISDEAEQGILCTVDRTSKQFTADTNNAASSN